MGRILIVLGIALIVIGLIIVFQDRLPFLRHLGRLPGDIAIKRDNVRIYFPLATSLLLSLILSLLLWFFRRGPQ